MQLFLKWLANLDKSFLRRSGGTPNGFIVCFIFTTAKYFALFILFSFLIQIPFSCQISLSCGSQVCCSGSNCGNISETVHAISFADLFFYFSIKDIAFICYHLCKEEKQTLQKLVVQRSRKSRIFLISLLRSGEKKWIIIQ